MRDVPQRDAMMRLVLIKPTRLGRGQRSCMAVGAHTMSSIIINNYNIDDEDDAVIYLLPIKPTRLGSGQGSCIATQHDNESH